MIIGFDLMCNYLCTNCNCVFTIIGYNGLYSLVQFLLAKALSSGSVQTCTIMFRRVVRLYLCPCCAMSICCTSFTILIAYDFKRMIWSCNESYKYHVNRKYG